MEYCLFSRFTQSVKSHPNSIACQIKENGAYKTYSYRTLYDMALKTAAFLKTQGLSRHERIGIILENSPWWPALYFGIVGSGCIAVPIDPKLTPQEVTNIVRDSQARLIFTSQEIYLPLKNMLSNIIAFKNAALWPFDEINKVEVNQDAIVPNSAGDIASILYTSGTTALPKGVMLTHKNFGSNFDSIKKLNLIKVNDNLISLLPLHHSYPFMVTLITPLLIGAKITYLASLKSEDLIKCAQETKATILIGVPQLFHILHKSIFEKLGNINFVLSVLKITDFSRRVLRFNLNKIILSKLHRNFGPCMRYFISGGARLDPKVSRELTLLGFTILEGYGLTETSPVVTFNPIYNMRFGSVGLPLPDVKIRINITDASNVGEVLIQGPNVMKGYYKRPKETEEVLKEGWLYSGDLGFIDKKGYLYLTGRSKEVIVLSSGKNIYPEEIENHYLRSPYIKEICVLETSCEGLQSLHGVIFPNIEYFRKTKEVNIQGKIRWLLENLSKELPSYKRIMGFTVVKEELPRTRLGKLKRYEINKKFLLAVQPDQLETAKSSHPEEVSLAPQPQIVKQTLEFLSRELKRSVTLNDHLELDLGIDSLFRIELGIGLEKLLNISIPDTVLAEVFTVNELVARLRELLLNQAGQPYVSIHQPTWGQIIKEKPSLNILNKINLNPTLLDKTITFLIVNLMRFLFRVFWCLTIEGEENIPSSKSAFLICPNHSSFLDGFVVASSVGIKTEINLFFLGYSGYFQHPIIRWAVKLARLIAIDPAINLTDAMQAAGFILANKKVLCIFPEGERSIDADIKDFKKGVGILVKELAVTVVPCYIQGSHAAWGRGKTFPKPYPLKIIFGRPCGSEELKEAGAKYSPQDDYEAIAFGLREKVAGLKENL